MSELPPTEGVDVATTEIDRLGTEATVALLISGQQAALDRSLAATAAIAAVVKAISAALRAGRRWVSFGAGTSGRLAALDAAELLPTFGLEPGRVLARIAGGPAALTQAIEGAEDDVEAGRLAASDLEAGDVALGISASGGAPYVLAAMQEARARGALTVGVVNVTQSALAGLVDLPIVVPTGPEPIAGSTRMRAGTSQKIVLNTISTATMIALGKTYRNRMVDLVATNAKLRARAERLVRDLAGDTVDAPALLAAASGNVKVAVAMARLGLSAAQAERLLAEQGGRLAALIDR